MHERVVIENNVVLMRIEDEPVCDVVLPCSGKKANSVTDVRERGQPR